MVAYSPRLWLMALKSSRRKEASKMTDCSPVYKREVVHTSKEPSERWGEIESVMVQERRHIGSKSRESPSPEGKREASVNLVGIWKHAVPVHQSYDEVGMEHSCKLGRPLQRLEAFCTAHCVVAVRLLAGHQASCLAGVVLLLITSLRLILRSTRCEEGVCGLLGVAGQGVTKIASGRLEVRLA
eukprot:1149319-Pelagomonas_calceolata.AAC.1